MVILSPSPAVTRTGVSPAVVKLASVVPAVRSLGFQPATGPESVSTMTLASVIACMWYRMSMAAEPDGNVGTRKSLPVNLSSFNVKYRMS